MTNLEHSIQRLKNGEGEEYSIWLYCKECQFAKLVDDCRFAPDCPTYLDLLNWLQEEYKED
jgi:hypothetical protein